MSTVTIQAEDYFIDALHTYSLKVGKGISQAVRDLLMPTISAHVVKESAGLRNPWARYCGCIPKEESVALKAYVAEQDKVDEESWK